MEKKTSFTLKKNNYFVCELPDITCQTTGRCVRCPAGNETPVKVVYMKFQQLLKNVYLRLLNVMRQHIAPGNGCNKLYKFKHAIILKFHCLCCSNHVIQWDITSRTTPGTYQKECKMLQKLRPSVFLSA